ncbi:Ig-like domain-containing protein, partial [bacterium]|nr:Ig-like domain-containing protein [bacterium]
AQNASLVQAFDAEGPALSPFGSVVVATGGLPPVVVPSRRGRLLYVCDPNDSTQTAYETATGVAVPIPGATFVAPELAQVAAAAVSLDGARLYSGGSADSILVANLTLPAALLAHVTPSPVIPKDDTPIPVVARVTASAPEWARGTVVSFEATSGTFVGTGAPSVQRAVDAGGFARAWYRSATAIAGNVTLTMRMGADSAAVTFEVTPDPSGVRPVVLAFQPVDSDTGVSVNSSVAADFSKAIDPESVDIDSFSLAPGGGPAVPGQFSFAHGHKRVVFHPEEPLAYGANHTLSLSTGIQDTYGNPLDNPGQISFQIETLPPPVQLHAVNPLSAASGGIVTLIGEGFHADDSLQVFFADSSAAILHATSQVIKTIVPAGAPAGPILVTVVVDADSSNAMPFVVLGSFGAPVLDPEDPVDLPASGQEIVALPAHRAYITSAAANAVLSVNYLNLMQGPSIPVGLHPYGIARSPEGGLAYVTNFFSNDISVIDTQNDAVTDVIAAGEHPTGIAVHPDGKSLYVANYGDSTLTIFDEDSTHATFRRARATTSTETTSRTIVVTPDGGLVVMGTSTGLLLMDPQNGSILEDVDLDASTQSIAVLPAGRFIIVLTTEGGLLLVDLGANVGDRVRASTSTDADARSIVVTPDGGFILVTLPDGV